MFLKSKWFWLCTIFTICASIFIGVVVHRANQPQEVIKVYKAVELPQHHISQEPVPFLRVDSAGAKTDTPVNTGSGDFSQDTETEITDAFTQTADELPPAGVDAAQVSNPDTEVDAEAEALAAALALAAEKLPELRIEIPRALERRYEVLRLSEELVSYVSSYGITPELSELAAELNKERDELREKIYGWCHEYLMYTFLDGSPFEPGGEFYELMEFNGMGIEVDK